METYLNEFTISGMIDYKIQNYTTKDKGMPYVAFLVKQSRLAGAKDNPKTYHSRFQIKSFNKDLVDKLIVIKNKISVVCKGRITVNTHKDQSGKWINETSLLADSVDITDYTDEPFEEKGSKPKEEAVEPKKEKAYQSPESKDIDVILEQFEKDKKNKLSKEIDDDDLPF